MAHNSARVHSQKNIAFHVELFNGIGTEAYERIIFAWKEVNNALFTISNAEMTDKDRCQPFFF